ncbi:uncharacterized protein LOC126870718 isoform X4 [Bombus huntii]|uniref:uncharacterized protein LOC126870718 isoform X4 n=1 Tax=Bombus huntii TaxID=85661 RepID=UPI0021AA5DF5|nr:uncharacterized protein LOC126870718 isoform X4 [Bombus huntii]
MCHLIIVKLLTKEVTMLRFRREFCATLLLLCVSRSTRLSASLADAEPVLIRPLKVYESLIKGVHDHFNNTCIILFHGTMNVIEKKGLEDMEGLLALQRYLSGSLNIRTVIMDFSMFKDRVGKTYHHIKRPLFVLLNDLDEIREQFISVSKWITMSYPTWLLFLRDGTRFDEFLSNVYVPFDCILMVTQRDSKGTGEIVRDVYQISKEDNLRSMKFGEWNAREGFQGPQLGLYQRRNDLNGRNIRVVSVHDPPVSRIIRNKAGQPSRIGGFFGEVIQLLQEGMNCTFTYMEASSWGTRLPNGTWTGSIRMLVEDKADLAATELMMSSDRLEAIKFTTPVYSTKCRAYIRRPDTTAVKWNTYLAPFAFNVWNAIGLTVVVVALTITGIDVLSRKVNWFPVDLRPNSRSTLSEILFYVFGAFCGQGMEPSPLDPTRLVHLNVHLTGVVVLAAYSAALISFLAIKTFVMPFTTMEGLLKDGTYRFAVVGDSADYSFFQNTSDTMLTVMFEELLARELDLPVNYFDGLNRVCQEKKYAFMTLDNMATVLQGKVECAVEPLDAIMQTTIAMAVPSHSPYRGIIDTNILLLRDSGILQRLLKLEWSSQMRWVVIQRTKYNRSAFKGELLECRNDLKEEVDLSPPELLYHGEYHDELPMIERERERKAPQLSSSFLTRHINAEQRRLVVIFIIRLGIHCRYPSRIVYQSVKLFDAVMDKLSVDTMMIQLYALASLWIVLKRQEKFHKIPSATKMVSLANDLYIGREDLLVDCERKILKILNFNITFADTFSLFTHHFISCEHYINVSEETGAFLYNCGCYMIDITLLDERFCRISARLISITVLELLLGIGLDVARDNTTPRWLFWRGLLSAVLSSPQRLEDKAIDSLRVIILRRVLDSQMQQDSFNVVYKKYCRSRYGRISKPFLQQVTRIPATETIFDP